MPSFRCAPHFLYFAPFPAFCSQEASTGAIRGTVADSSGGRIGGATVVLVNLATNYRYYTTTDVTGRFAFELLAPGDYSGRAESPGMSPQTTPRLHVDVGGTAELFRSGSIKVFESASSSVYNGITLSIWRRMTSGIYFMLSYAFDPRGG
jgi:hypothetical protein